MCEGLSALHDAHPHGVPEKMAIHPVVRVHPETGRKAIYVNEHFTRRIVEMSAPESEVFLRFLTNWVQSPRFTVRYHWTAGTIGMWDNRATQHYVLNDFEGERIIQRVTVMGDQPNGPGPRWQPWTEGAPRSAMSRHDRQLSGFLKDRTAEAADRTAGLREPPPARNARIPAASRTVSTSTVSNDLLYSVNSGFCMLETLIVLPELRYI